MSDQSVTLGVLPVRIAFLIPTLVKGGAERVAVELSNAWTEAGQDVHLLTYQSATDTIAYPLDQGITSHFLDVLQADKSSAHPGKHIARYRALSAALQAIRPDVVVSFLTEANILAIVTAKRLGLPILISERTHPGHHVVPGIHKLCRKLTYRYADKLVVQSPSVAEWYATALGIEDAEILENPIDVTRFAPPLASEGTREKQLLAVTRLDPGKAVDVVLRAFVRIA